MPSLNDVFNQLKQANTNLAAIHNDLLQVRQSTDQVRNAVNNQTAYVQALVQGQTYTNQSLHHLSQQNETVICLLGQIARHTCQSLNESHLQTRLQKKMERVSTGVLEILQHAHPEGAVISVKNEELRTKVEACCPPEKEPPICRMEPCPNAGSLDAPPQEPSFHQPD
ncbi:hypothetical protein ABZY93_21885 [Streptomyces smyrnaeus]|uniref:hypothetical protein n=1 Tax=Streptomyces smyrnaeus TaxID=1387713 RepID=UPI0033B7C876